jgi:GLPGLI family protein
MKIIMVYLLSTILLLHELQAQFIVKGKIEFEKTVNFYKQMEIGDDGWGAEMKKEIPEFKHTYFNLMFTDGKAIYQPGKESTEKSTPWGEGPATDNIVYTDLTSRQTTSAKQVFDESFLIKDSLRKYKWRLTNETRKIAGFECKRATTIIMDSVFVVAFYTEEIIASGGPESFNGLPGMIMGIVIPRMFTNWYATKIEVQDIKETAITPPKKGKPTNYQGMDKKIQESLKQWGKWGTKYIWQITI